MKLDLKVFKNSKNGQAFIYLPRKDLNKIPDTVKVEFPKSILKIKMPKEENLW